MSRQIDLSAPLTDEDRQYLVDRADFTSIARNEAALAGRQFESSDLAGDPLEAHSLENATDTPPAEAEPEVVEPAADEEVAASKKK